MNWKKVKLCDKPIHLHTANDDVTTQELVNLWVADLNRGFDFYVLPGESPSVLSLGLLCRAYRPWCAFWAVRLRTQVDMASPMKRAIPALAG